MSRIRMREGIVIAVDFGRAADRTVMTMLERYSRIQPSGDEDEPYQYRFDYLIPMITVFEHTPYPEIVRNIRTLWNDHDIKAQGELVIDATGVGTALADMLVDAGLQPICVTISGGQSLVAHDYFHYTVPKQELTTQLVVCLQAAIIKIADGTENAELLLDELQNFGYQVNRKTGAQSYGNMTDETHDDAVMSAALGAWYCKYSERWLNKCIDGSGPTKSEQATLNYDPLQRGD